MLKLQSTPKKFDRKSNNEEENTTSKGNLYTACSSNLLKQIGRQDKNTEKSTGREQGS